MPTCTTESLAKMWPPHHQGNGTVFSSGSQNGSIRCSPSSYSPCSPNSISPLSTSPVSTLRRLRRGSSTGSIQESFVIHSDMRDSRSQSPVLQQSEDDSLSFLASIIGWYPCFLLKIVRACIFAVVPLSLRQILFAVPTFWITLWFWVFWKCVQFPISIFKWFVTLVITPSAERNRKKRTVLISGGSTIQALHLARNFYSAGARVVVCEVDGLFALCRFSTAVNRFYTVPRPTSDQQQNYVRALCEIVEKEKVAYYIPVSATTAAYYDAVAKPHLELLGCTCFCPGIKEAWTLDDTLEIMKRCQSAGIATPEYHAITSRDDLLELYDNGTIHGVHIMSTAGPSALRERTKVVLPLSRNDLKIPNDISEQRPWVVVQDLEGEHYLTCTTVKESQVIANITCRLDKNNNGLVPVEHKEINLWLSNFFSKLNLLRPVSGHISFRFVQTQETILPLSSRVGVSLPYICHTSVHPKLVWKPCRHFSRQNSGPLVAENGRYWMPETVINTLRHPSVESMTRLIGTVLDKREALFVIWDPLPYCAYYHMQLPFRNVLGFVKKRQDRFPRPVAAPVH